MHLEPLEIKISVLAPVVSPLRRQPHPLHLDAMLISVMTSRIKAAFPNLVSDATYDTSYHPENGHKQGVPLAVCGDKRPIYQSSVAFISGEPIYTEYNWIKKPVSADLIKTFIGDKKQATFKPSGESSGTYRGWMESMPGVMPSVIKFECVGNKEVITDLLADVRGIGVMRRIGLGEVLAYSVDPINKDPATCGLILDDQPARELPCVDWPDGDKYGWSAVSAAYRPPYWNPRNKDICWCPSLELTVPGLAQASREKKPAKS